MPTWFDVKFKGVSGRDKKDDKEVIILGRVLRVTEEGLEYEADRKHRQMILDQLRLSEGSKGLSSNVSKEEKQEEEEEGEDLVKEEATSFRALAARFNYLSSDCPDLQFPIKQCSKEMAKPKAGSWGRMKKVARYLLNRRSVVWRFDWQDEPSACYVAADSDWGGNIKDRKSTSGGVWMLGRHTIKTWSASQVAIALSSAEAEFYAMIEAVTRSKGLLSLAKDLGYADLSNVVKLATDSSAAKSVVCKRGLGKMRHLEIIDLWLQQKVLEGNVVVSKILGSENPADLMTKYLSSSEITDRCKEMNIDIR